MLKNRRGRRHADLVENDAFSEVAPQALPYEAAVLAVILGIHHGKLGE